MAKSKKQASDTGFESVENALSKTEQYIEENQKSLTIIVIAIFIVVGGYLGYRKFYLEPTEKEAKSQMFYAEQYFEKDSFNLALYGDGMYPGFIDIIDDYGVTRSAELAGYYAGISYLRLGDYEEAISYLKKFDANSKMISQLAKGAIGDAYVQLGELEKGLDYYESAASDEENDFLSPLYLKKAALVYQELEHYNKALSIFQEIKSEYPLSEEGRDADRYIAALQAKLQ